MIFKLAATAFGLAVLACIAVLAWMPSPDVRDLQLVPTTWGMWLDTRDFERNIIGGGVLQLAVLALVAVWLQGRALFKLTGIASVISLAVFTLAECVQLFLPRRTFDLMDIGAAVLGISIVNAALLVVALPIIGLLALRKS
ncbi:MAG: hypothetical protein ACOVMP_00990 [Chthoniobacterales bacterium]